MQFAHTTLNRSQYIAAPVLRPPTSPTDAHAMWVVGHATQAASRSQESAGRRHMSTPCPMATRASGTLVLTI